MWDILGVQNGKHFPISGKHWAKLDVPEAGWRQVDYFPGIFALLRAMASSTAFSCFSSSSRRERVLLGLPEPELEAEPEPDPAPGAGGLPADTAAGPFPEDLGGGDRGRFLERGNKKRID